MSFAEFVVQIVQALAWPVAVMVLAIVFRKQLGDLAKRVESLGAGSVQVKLRDTTERAETAAERLDAAAEKAVNFVDVFEAALGRSEGTTTWRGTADGRQGSEIDSPQKKGKNWPES